MSVHRIALVVSFELSADQEELLLERSERLSRSLNQLAGIESGGGPEADASHMVDIIESLERVESTLRRAWACNPPAGGGDRP